MRNKLFFLLTILAISSLLTACAGVAMAQSSTPAAQTTAGEETGQVYRTITVSGSGKAYLTPDVAYINIGVHSEGASASGTVTDNSTQTSKVVDTLKKFGIAEKDIRTINFSIYPQPQYDQEGKPTGEIKYSVDNTVYVTMRDLTKVGDLLDAVVKAGANTINGIQFDVVDTSAAMSAARKAAIANAQAIAEEMAAAAGVTLGPIQTINLYGGSAPIVVQARAMDTASSVPIQPGQMEITVEVNIVYEIR
jgi:uncharacterized protein YggE